MGVTRRIVIWSVPVLLVAALGWSLMPRSGTSTVGPPAPPASAHHAGTAQGQTTPASQGAAPPADRLATGEIKSGNLVSTDAAGHKRWQIAADDLSLAADGTRVHLQNVHAVFYNADGSSMTVTGGAGAYDTQSKDVQLVGDVHGVGTNGREIFADQLSYSPASQLVTGVGNVRVLEERVIMYADRMTSDTRLGQTRFFGHVHMTVR
jgi:LPS export ABC transporter protein LptC